MSQPALTAIVGAVANGVTLVVLMPQIYRLFRTGLTSGVSPTWAATGMTINVGWFGYVIAAEVWFAVPAVVVALTSYVLTLWLLVRNSADITFGLVISVILAVVFVVVGTLAGWTVLGTTLALAHGVQFAPSVIAAWRSYAPAGVAPATWLLAGAEGALWALYGMLVNDGPIVLFGLTELVTAAAVLARLWLTRHRIRAVLETAP